VHQTWGSFSVNDVSASTPVYWKFGDDDVSRDPAVRDWLEQGDNSVDPAERKAAYKKALTRIAEESYSVPLYSLPVYYAYTKDLDFKPYPDELPRFWEYKWK
jgi:peptide/nickel transport system substrate-binding protein